MRKLIEFLFGGIIEEIALARADQIIEQMVEDHVGNMQHEMEGRVESAVNGLYSNMEHRIDELDSRLDDIQSEVDATKEEVDDMKGAA
tara:strand:- start:127 stop:390 length:264 start_codon:yes stop_codon:yes gene_type:complete